MGFILGRVALGDRAAGAQIDRAVFARAFEALRPGRVARSDMQVVPDAGYGYHAQTGIDQSGAETLEQPLRLGALTVLADARLYNRADLARALGVKADLADIGLIALAYQRWGADCLAHMNGDFAFAIHDTAAGEVFLARDHIGVRPLYWTERKGTLIFATLLQGLVGFDDLDWPANEERIARFLRNPHDFRTESFLQDVEIVGPGHWVRISAQGVTRQRWWDPAAVPRHDQITAQEAHEELRALTRAAVAARLPAAAAAASDAPAPVGVHFSGGVDSTLMLILAQEALAARGTRLTAAYAWCPPLGPEAPDMGPRDERHLLTARCDALGVPLRYGAADGTALDALARMPMELQGMADLFDEVPVLQQIAADGVEVVLSGWGGDEGLSTHGLGHFAWLARRGQLRPVLRAARRMSGGLRHPLRIARFLMSQAVAPSLPDWVNRRFRYFDEIYPESIYPSAPMRARIDALPPMPMARLVPDADRFMHVAFLNGHLGERMASWAAWSAPLGFEYRYPLTDRALLDFLLGLPREIRFGTGMSRFLMGQLFGDILPRGVTKADLANQRKRAESFRTWRQMMIRDLEAGRFDADCPWLDMPALRAAIRTPIPEDVGALTLQIGYQFEALRIYEMWRRHQARQAARAGQSVGQPD